MIAAPSVMTLRGLTDPIELLGSRYSETAVNVLCALLLLAA